MNRTVRLVTVTVVALLAITPAGRAADSGIERLWINHDQPQSRGLRHAPEFYE